MENYGGSFSDAQQFGLYCAGNMCFGACVFVANIIVIHKSSIHNSYSIGIPILSILVYLGIFGYTSTNSYFEENFHTFMALYTNPRVLASFLFSILCISVMEVYYYYFSKLIFNEE